MAGIVLYNQSLIGSVWIGLSVLSLILT
jgi:hypothetical protein